MRLLQFDLQNKNLNFKLDLKVETIKADQDSLKQALINLLLNSIQASKPEGIIEIAAERVREQICLKIKDYGQGMTKEELKEAFTPFFTTKEQGTGLGLAIVQQIITRHEGQIKINSLPGKGTEVIIYLPYE